VAARLPGSQLKTACVAAGPIRRPPPPPSDSRGLGSAVSEGTRKYGFLEKREARSPRGPASAVSEGTGDQQVRSPRGLGSAVS
jgi:hypothetical protein